MLHRLSDLIHKNAKVWLIITLLLLNGLFTGFIFPLFQALMKGDSGIFSPIDVQFFYTPEKAYGLVASYGEYGRRFYRNFELSGDLLYPIVYTLFLSLSISWLFQRGFSPGSKMQQLNTVPLGAWTFDLLENLGIVAMLSIYPSTPASLAWLTAVFTMIKWFFAGVSVIMLLVGIGAAIRKAVSR